MHHCLFDCKFGFAAFWTYRYLVQGDNWTNVIKHDVLAKHSVYCSKVPSRRREDFTSVCQLLRRERVMERDGCQPMHALCAETTVFESSSDSGHFVLRKAGAHAIITDRRLVPSLMPKEDLDKPQGPAVFILASDLAR